MRRYVYLALGTVALAIGAVGAFVPVLPTTPFLLVAAACYAQSSHRFYTWLLSNRVLGDYIRNYREGRGMRPRDKIISLITLWAGISYSALARIDTLWVQILLFAIAIAVTAHVCTIPTCRTKPPTRDSERAPSETPPG